MWRWRFGFLLFILRIIGIGRNFFLKHILLLKLAPNPHGSSNMIAKILFQESPIHFNGRGSQISIYIKISCMCLCVEWRHVCVSTDVKFVDWRNYRPGHRDTNDDRDIYLLSIYLYIYIKISCLCMCLSVCRVTSCHHVVMLSWS